MRRLLRLWSMDPALVAGVILLTLLGLAMIYSAGQTNVPDPVVVGAWRRQAVWFGLALVAFTAVSRIPLGKSNGVPAGAFSVGARFAHVRAGPSALHVQGPPSRSRRVIHRDRPPDSHLQERLRHHITISSQTSERPIGIWACSSMSPAGIAPSATPQRWHRSGLGCPTAGPQLTEARPTLPPERRTSLWRMLNAEAVDAAGPTSSFGSVPPVFARRQSEPGPPRPWGPQIA